MMVSAKEFIWNGILEAGMDIETFRQCYKAISLIVPNDWKAIPRDIFNVFSGMIDTFEKRQIKNQYSVSFYQIDAFSIWLIKSGNATVEDAEAWKHIAEIREGINSRKKVFALMKMADNKDLLDLYKRKASATVKLKKRYQDAITLSTITLTDGRLLNVTDDWYV